MKNLLNVALFSLAAAGLNAGTASAWLHNHFCKREVCTWPYVPVRMKCCHSWFGGKCCGMCPAPYFMKPYNAFSLPCFGTIGDPCSSCMPPMIPPMCAPMCPPMCPPISCGPVSCGPVCCEAPLPPPVAICDAGPAIRAVPMSGHNPVMATPVSLRSSNGMPSHMPQSLPPATMTSTPVSSATPTQSGPQLTPVPNDTLQVASNPMPNRAIQPVAYYPVYFPAYGAGYVPARQPMHMPMQAGNPYWNWNNPYVYGRR